MTNNSTKELAKKMYKEIFPNASFSVLSGHSEMFDRFMNLAKKIRSGEIK